MGRARAAAVRRSNVSVGIGVTAPVAGVLMRAVLSAGAGDRIGFAATAALGEDDDGG
jgi:hypothetical protein